jgi:hypothetical protein
LHSKFSGIVFDALTLPGMTEGCLVGWSFPDWPEVLDLRGGPGFIGLFGAGFGFSTGRGLVFM